MLEYVLSVVLTCAPLAAWQVTDKGESVNGLRWWAVSSGSVTHATYNTHRHAELTAAELTRRGLGPYWYNGLKAHEVIAIERAVSNAVLERLFDEEQRARRSGSDSPVTAPVPKHLTGPETAPPPREMFPYAAPDGTTRHYVREFWEGGVLRRCVREGDPQFERRAVPVRPGDVIDV